MTTSTTIDGGAQAATKKPDKIRTSFLTAMAEEGEAFCRGSSLIDLRPEPGRNPPERYVLRLFCTGLVQDSAGVVHEADYFEVGIWFHPNFQRRPEPLKLLTMLTPVNVFHPNIAYPHVCAGNISRSTTITELISIAWKIITYRNWAADDGLSPAACQWARENQDRFPTDPRPLFNKARRSFSVDLVGQ